LKEENQTDFVAFYKDFDATIKLRKRPSSDLNVFAQIYQYNEYQPLVATFQKHFPNDKTLSIIDAGSNIGLTSVFLSKHFPNSKCIAIEPDSSNFDSVSFNLSANNVTNAVKVKGGLWSKNTNLKIVNDFRDQKDWSIRVEETQDEGDLKAFSIQYLMQENHLDSIDILKIDIEGSEREVFTGLAADVSFLAKTKCIAIEIHDEFDCRTDIYKILDEYKFQYFESGELTIGINQSFYNSVQPKNRLRELDFLRGIAIILVIFRHQLLFDFLKTMGWIGVDLFFVLSGFLVSGLLFKEYQKFGSINAKLFLIRRGFKIYPIYYLTLIGYILPRILLHKLDLTKVFYDLIFIQNYALGWGYLYTASWSLAVEEHFYFGLALLLWLIFNKKAFSFDTNPNGFSNFEKLLCFIFVTILGLRFASNYYFPVDTVRHITMTHFAN